MNRRDMLGSAGCERRVPNDCPLSVEARPGHAPRSTLPLSVELYDARLPTSALVVLVVLRATSSNLARAMDISLDSGCRYHAHLTTSALPSFPTRGHLPQDIEVNRNARPSSRHLLQLREDDETSMQFFRDRGGNEELLRPCSFSG